MYTKVAIRTHMSTIRPCPRITRKPVKAAPGIEICVIIIPPAAPLHLRSICPGGKSVAGPTISLEIRLGMAPMVAIDATPETAPHATSPFHLVRDRDVPGQVDGRRRADRLQRAAWAHGPPGHRLAVPGDHRPRGPQERRHPGGADVQHRHGPASPGLP